MEIAYNEQIENLVNYALFDATNRNRIVRLDKINESTFIAISNSEIMDISGFTRVIDIYGIKHTFKKHGNAITEAKRGQIAINKEDFVLIPQIVWTENVHYSGKNKIGKHCLTYEKEIDETIYYYIEEIREGRKELAMNTLYKKRKPPVRVAQ